MAINVSIYVKCFIYQNHTYLFNVTQKKIKINSRKYNLKILQYTVLHIMH